MTDPLPPSAGGMTEELIAQAQACADYWATNHGERGQMSGYLGALLAEVRRLRAVQGEAGSERAAVVGVVDDYAEMAGIIAGHGEHMIKDASTQEIMDDPKLSWHSGWAAGCRAIQQRIRNSVSRQARELAPKAAPERGDEAIVMEIGRAYVALRDVPEGCEDEEADREAELHCTMKELNAFRIASHMALLPGGDDNGK